MMAKILLVTNWNLFSILLTSCDQYAPGCVTIGLCQNYLIEERITLTTCGNMYTQEIVVRTFPTVILKEALEKKVFHQYAKEVKYS